jgi:hypothetical protein
VTWSVDTFPVFVKELLVDDFGHRLALGAGRLYEFRSALEVEESPAGSPAYFALHQNFPNPFNPVTTIPFTLSERSHATLRVFDGLGREVALLIDEVRDPGRHEIRFDASELASGVYLCRLIAGSATQSRKMALLR